jgi:hypothetical protein
VTLVLPLYAWSPWPSFELKINNMAVKYTFEIANASCDDDGHPKRTGKSFSSSSIH